MHSLSRRLVAGAAVCSGLALLAACADHGAPTGPRSLDPALSAASEPAAKGNPFVHFLQPIAAAGAFTGTFDATLAPDIEVYLDGSTPCAANASTEQCPARVARFASADKGVVGVRMDAKEQHYIANWKLGAGRDPSATYRVVVRVGAQVLDYESVSGIQGGTLPIKVRIEQGALDVVRVPIGAAGGAVATADGDLALHFPAGALADEKAITVESLKPSASDAWVIGGTKYEFGPHGTQFGEPVEVSVRYDDKALPKGVSPQILRLHRLVDGEWQLVKGEQTVNQVTRTVTGTTESFSTYALLPSGFVRVQSGEYHACGLTGTGEAWCWGRNDEGQLGATSSETCLRDPADATSGVACSKVAVKVEGGLSFQSIEPGTGHTCAITTGGDAYCWGRNVFGQLGTGGTARASVPVRVATTLKFQQIAAEYESSCGLTTAGDVYCWGSNRQNVLGSPTLETCGTNSTACSTTPVRVSVPTASKVDVGLLHACALTSAGDAYCWGWNAFGQIGTGARSQNEPPSRVPGGPHADISAGAIHTCAVSGTGSASCWGTNYNTGALGDGSNANQYSPVAVAGGLTFAQIDATNGNYIFTHSCAVTTSNQAYCWGANLDGALGVSMAPQTCKLGDRWPEYDCALTPIAVSGGLAFQQITSGRGFTCGYSTDGKVYCWGLNSTGQLGNGTTSGSRSPVLVATAP